MIQTQRLFLNRQREFVEWFGFRVAALLSIQLRKIAERSGDIRVIRTKRLLPHFVAVFIEWLGLGIAALCPIQVC